MLKTTNDKTLHEPVYTIGHAANKLGIAITTLRMYEEAGLVITHRTPSNRRLYSRHDIKYIDVIRDLINSHHLNIEAIKRFIALIPCWEIKKCPSKIRRNCPAFLDSFKPCWSIPGALCGESSENCQVCEVYRSCPQVLKNPKNVLDIGLKKDLKK